MYINCALNSKAMTNRNARKTVIGVDLELVILYSVVHM